MHQRPTNFHYLSGFYYPGLRLKPHNISFILLASLPAEDKQQHYTNRFISALLREKSPTGSKPKKTMTHRLNAGFGFPQVLVALALQDGGSLVDGGDVGGTAGGSKANKDDFYFHLSTKYHHSHSGSHVYFPT